MEDLIRPTETTEDEDLEECGEEANGSGAFKETAILIQQTNPLTIIMAYQIDPKIFELINSISANHNFVLLSTLRIQLRICRA